jgi:hypothetical protein
MDSILPAAALTVSSLVNNLLTSAKTARELSKQSADSALKEQIADIFDCILDVKDRVLELDADNRFLREQLKEKASMKRDPAFGYYFIDGDPDPHCSKCYEGSGKVIHLTKARRSGNGIRRDCRECSITFWEEPPQSGSVVRASRSNHWG